LLLIGVVVQRYHEILSRFCGMIGIVGEIALTVGNAALMLLATTLSRI